MIESGGCRGGNSTQEHKMGEHILASFLYSSKKSFIMSMELPIYRYITQIYKCYMYQSMHITQLVTLTVKEDTKVYQYVIP